MLTDWSSKWSIYTPKKLAIVDPEVNEQLDYFGLNQRAEQLAHHLKDQYGISNESKVAVLSEFTIELFVLFAAAQKLGFTIVPVNYRLSPQELAYILNDSEPNLLYFDEKYSHLLTQKGSFLKPIAELKSLSLLPHTNTGKFSWLPISPEHPVFILYTSGTTGFPKGSLYSHQMLFWNSLNTILRLQLSGLDNTVVCTPSFHTGGWNVLATPLLFAGGTIYLMPKFDAPKLLDWLNRFQITLLMTVPTMTKMLSECEGFGSMQFPKLRNYIVGGEALPLPIIDLWASKGIMIRQGYGLTEAGPNITSLPQEDAIRKRGSIGFFNTYIEAKLVNEEGEEVGNHQSGELWLKGPVVSLGYWNNPEASNKATQGAWFKTGDVMVQDGEGYLYLVDRIKNMYISGGENVYPAEIEKELRQHPAISEVAVFGIPDEKWGEVGCACYTSVGSTQMSAAELKLFCEQRLAKYKVPKKFVFLTQMPKNDTGKLDKKQLKEWHVQGKI